MDACRRDDDTMWFQRVGEIAKHVFKTFGRCIVQNVQIPESDKARTATKK
jgi:hypothetical protein